MKEKREKGERKEVEGRGEKRERGEVKYRERGTDEDEGGGEPRTE